MSRVAPARERGLKSCSRLIYCIEFGCRSRKGAWIEMSALQANVARENGRSRKGAWIEINLHRDYRNTPVSLPQGSVD